MRNPERIMVADAPAKERPGTFTQRPMFGQQNAIYVEVKLH